jgi:hypothetical protein
MVEDRPGHEHVARSGETLLQDIVLEVEREHALERFGGSRMLGIVDQHVHPAAHEIVCLQRGKPRLEPLRFRHAIRICECEDFARGCGNRSVPGWARSPFEDRHQLGAAGNDLFDRRRTRGRVVVAHDDFEAIPRQRLCVECRKTLPKAGEVLEMGYDNADLHHAARIVPQELKQGPAEAD